MDTIDLSLKQLIDKDKIEHEETKYRVRDRINSWKQQARFYYDSDLEKLKNLMLKVFKEENPLLDDKNEEQLVTYLKYKKTKYSDDLREGLAVTLALIGNYSELLRNCSRSMVEPFVDNILCDLFSDMTLKRLATMESIMPFFAEASPDVYLKQMTNLTKNTALFQQLTARDEAIMQVGFRWLGIVKSFETLAWENDFLVRSVLLLAELASFDKHGGNILPRPKDTLTGIFWPWHPQTTANINKICAAATILIDHYHQLGWDVLCEAIKSQFGMPHRLPQIRKSLPSDFDNNAPREKKQGEDLIHSYEGIMLAAASKYDDLLYPLAQYLGHIKDDDCFEQALLILSSKVVNLDDSVKEPIWTCLQKTCIRHRLYKDADWSMPDDKLAEIDNLVETIIPESPFYQNKHLFDRAPWDWHEYNDYQKDAECFQLKQIEAAKSICGSGDYNNLFDFMRFVDNPSVLGSTLYYTDIILDVDTISSLLDDADDKAKDFLGGYLWQCINNGKEKWLTLFENVDWDEAKKTLFLSYLPISSSICHFCEKWLRDREVMYWNTYQMRVVPTDDTDMSIVIHKAICFNRPDIAVEFLFWSSFRAHHFLGKENAMVFDTCAEALIRLAKSQLVEKVDPWHIGQMIKGLQNLQRTHEQNESLKEIEWSYLPLFDSRFNNEVSPVALNSALAEDPEFFHQIIKQVNDLRKGFEAESQADIELSKKAYSLLSQWKKMPGVANNVLDYDNFEKWYNGVLESFCESDLLPFAKEHIGNILVNTPPDPSGLWIDERIVALLDKEENEDIRRGYYLAVFNSRGAHFVDFSGKEDFELSKRYSEKADDVENKGYINFAETLRGLAYNYEKEARSAIRDGEHFKQDTEEL